MHGIRSVDAVEELLSSPRYIRLANQAAAAQSSSEVIPAPPPPQSFAAPVPPGHPSAARFGRGDAAVNRGFQPYRAEHDPFVIPTSSKGSPRSKQSSLKAIEDNVPAVMRECIKHFLAHPEKYGANIRKMLEDELAFIVKLWASETSTSMSQQYSSSGVGFLPPIGGGGGYNVHYASQQLRSFVENNVFDLQQGQSPMDAPLAADSGGGYPLTPQSSSALTVTGANFSPLVALSSSPHDARAQQQNRSGSVITSSAAQQLASAKAAFSESCALRTHLSKLDGKMQLLKENAEGYRTQLLVAEASLKHAKADADHDEIELHHLQQEVLSLREQLGQASVALDSSSLAKKELIAEHQLARERINRKVEELQNELRYVYAQLRSTQAKCDNANIEVVSLSTGYSTTQEEVEELTKELNEVLTKLDKRTRVVARQRALMEQRHTEMIFLAKAAADLQTLSGDRSLVHDLLEAHRAWKYFLFYRTHRRDFHFYSDKTVEVLYGQSHEQPDSSLSITEGASGHPENAATGPLAASLHRNFAPSSDGGYCNVVSFSTTLWRDVADFIVDLAEQRRQQQLREAMLDFQRHQDHQLHEASMLTTIAVHQEPLGVSPGGGTSVTSPIGDAAAPATGSASARSSLSLTPGAAALMAQMGMSHRDQPIPLTATPGIAGGGGASAASVDMIVPPASVEQKQLFTPMILESKMPPLPPPCELIDVENPFVLRFVGQEDPSSAPSIILDSVRHLHVFNASSLLCPREAVKSNTLANTIFLSRAAGRAIMYSFWRQRYAAYLIMLERRTADVSGSNASPRRSFSDESPPTPADFTTALYFFLENTWGKAETQSVAQEIRPGTPTERHAAHASHLGGAEDAGITASSPTAAGHPEGKKGGAHHPPQRSSPLWPPAGTLPEHALQPAAFEETDAVRSVSSNASLVLHSLLSLAFEYKDVDADYRMFYLVAFQLIPESYAINFIAITSKIFANADTMLLSTCELEAKKQHQPSLLRQLSKASQQQPQQRQQSLAQVENKLESVLTQLPKTLKTLLEDKSIYVDEDDDDVTSSKTSTEKPREGDEEEEGSTGKQLPGASKAGIGLAQAMQVRKFVGNINKKKLTSVSVSDQLHDTILKCDSRMRRGRSCKLPLHNVLEVVERVGFSVFEVALALKFLTTDDRAGGSFLGLHGNTASGSSFRRSSFCDAGSGGAGEGPSLLPSGRPDPLSLRCSQSMSPIDSQRVAFAIGMDQPGNVIDVNELFQLDANGRPSNFYDELLSCYLSSVERTQRAWMKEVIIPSCRCCGLSTPEEREKSCMGIIAPGRLTKNIEKFLKDKLMPKKSPGDEIGKPVNQGVEITGPALADAAKTLSAAFLTRCSDNQGIRSNSGDAVPRPFGPFAVDFPASVCQTNEFLGDPDVLAGIASSSVMKRALNRKKSDAAAARKASIEAPSSPRRKSSNNFQHLAEQQPAADMPAKAADDVSLLSAILLSRQIVFLLPYQCPVALTKEEVDRAGSKQRVMTERQPIIGPRIAVPASMAAFETDIQAECDVCIQRVQNHRSLNNPLDDLLKASAHEESLRLQGKKGKAAISPPHKGLGIAKDPSTVYAIPTATSKDSGIDVTFSTKGIASRDDGDDDDISTWPISAFYTKCAMPLEFALKSVRDRRVLLRIPAKCLPLKSYRVEAYACARELVGLGEGGL